MEKVAPNISDDELWLLGKTWNYQDGIEFLGYEKDYQKNLFVYESRQLAALATHDNLSLIRATMNDVFAIAKAEHYTGMQYNYRDPEEYYEESACDQVVVYLAEAQ